MKLIFTSCLVWLLAAVAHAQVPSPPPSSTTNKGNDFWVAYGHHQYFEAENVNTQNMTVYISVTDLPAGVAFATVTVEIDSSATDYANWFRRVYQIPANTVISLDDSASANYLISYSPSCSKPYGPIPKGDSIATGCGDYRVLDPLPPMGTGGERIFRNRGIHITSDEPIVAYAHIYGSANSGATMLIPYNSWGLSYTSVNSRQADAQSAYSFFYVMAANDNTPVKIIPSQPSRLGKPAGVPIYVNLQKGQLYQYVGMADAQGNGVQLTGSIIESLDSSKPIAVFAGCSRTSGESAPTCAPSTRDNDMQQCFPHASWGTDFLTAPFSQATNSTLFSPGYFRTTVYKVLARDSATEITINDSAPRLLNANSFYLFSTGLPARIKANKPIMVAQFMTSNNCFGSDIGDPEMIYLSPTERGIKQTGFFRNTQQFIDVNYLTLIVPNDGLGTLTIDTVPYQSQSNVVAMRHPWDSNYTLVIRGWTAQARQCIVKSDKRFTGITYGLGVVESYGYNIGANFYLNTPNVYPTARPKIKGTVFCDMNSNGIMDAAEFPRANVQITLSNGNYTFSDVNGYYEIDCDTIGTYVTTHMPPADFVAVPSTRSYVFTTLDTVVVADVALQPIAARSSMTMHTVPAFASALSGAAFPYFIVYENTGTSNVSTSARLNYNAAQMVYDSCSDKTITQAAGSIATATTTLKPGERKTFMPYLRVKNTLGTGDSIKTVFTVATNATLTIDSFYNRIEAFDVPIRQTATTAITPTQIAAGQPVEYTIYFKNINTYAIRHLRITDTLSAQLQANSVQIVNASHPCKVLVKGNKILFEFLNINLTDAATNQFKSSGYIRFRIRPKTSITVGSTISNSSTLYFDYDNPVTSNTAYTVVNTTGTLPVKIIRYVVALKNNTAVANNWQVGVEENVLHYSVQRSLNGKEFTTIGRLNATGKTDYSFTDERLRAAQQSVLYYRLEVVDKDGRKEYSDIKTVRIKPATTNFSMYPNPTRNSVTLETFDVSQVIVYDYVGRTVTTLKPTNIQHSVTTLSGLSKGYYMVATITINGEKQVQKLIVE